MCDQATFDFNAPAKEAQSAMPEEVDALVAYLEQKGPCWTTAKQIKAELGIKDRKLRILKSAARNKIVSGPGSPGYRYIKHSTLVDVQETAARVKSQITEMQSQYIGLLNLAHNMLHKGDLA